MRPVTLEVLSDGRSLGTTVAALYREDLKAAGIGDGRHGFEFRLPDAERPADAFTRIFDVRDVESGTPLGHSPFTATDDPTRVLRGARLRRFLADQYFTGHGLEVGALHRPMPLPSRVRVSYADAFTADELIRMWSPEVDGRNVTPVDIVTDATTLQEIDDERFDFAIASHLVEHLEDPVRCLRNLARVTKRGGFVFLALPDRRSSFDAPRRPTTIAHVLRDHCGDPGASRREHYEEWVALVERLTGPEATARLADLQARRYPIHFHVWSPDEFTLLLHELRTSVGLSLTLDLFKANGHEGVWMLRRDG